MKTPLFKYQNGFYYQQFKKGSKIYAITTDFNITKNNQYEIINIYGVDVEIINDLNEKEIYTSDWFSMTKINY